MKLYLVRHGESKSNALGIHQGEQDELSPDGLRQAKTVANRFRDIEIEIIISSPYARAAQTAEEISKTIHKPVFYTDLLKEIKRPSQIVGQKANDAEVIRIKEVLKKNARLADWHFSDEENFYDVQKRAFEFLEYLKLFKEENILVVTHGAFMLTFVFSLCLGEDLTPDAFYKIEHFFMTKNTGITVCGQRENGSWKLETWMDHAHLG